MSSSPAPPIQRHRHAAQQPVAQRPASLLAPFRPQFPRVVNEKAARVVAGCVVVLTALALLTGSVVVVGFLFVGFVARVLYGPRYSLFGRFATQVLGPRLGAPTYVSGPPKRFAQGVGVVFSGSGFLLWMLGYDVAGSVVLLGLLLAASLEAGLGVCLGCITYRQLQRFNIVSKESCVTCATGDAL